MYCSAVFEVCVVDSRRSSLVSSRKNIDFPADYMSFFFNLSVVEQNPPQLIWKCRKFEVLASVAFS